MKLVEFGRAIGHQSRVEMLQALMGGKALPAGELAYRAGISNQTASSHLRELVRANLLYKRKCGRFHYYEITSETVAGFIEEIACAMPEKRDRGRGPAVGHALKKARFCYDHLAGELGVNISGKLVEMGALTLDQDSFHLPGRKHRIFREIGVDTDETRTRRRRLCPRCVDWTERLPHVAGALGAAIAEKMIERGFIVRSRNDRSVGITESGRKLLIDQLGFSPSFFADAPDIRKPHYRA